MARLFFVPLSNSYAICTGIWKASTTLLLVSVRHCNIIERIITKHMLIIKVCLLAHQKFTGKVTLISRMLISRSDCRTDF